MASVYFSNEYRYNSIHIPQATNTQRYGGPRDRAAARRHAYPHTPHRVLRGTVGTSTLTTRPPGSPERTERRRVGLDETHRARRCDENGKTLSGRVKAYRRNTVTNRRDREGEWEEREREEGEMWKDGADR